jgi:hypothetical protein
MSGDIVEGSAATLTDPLDALTIGVVRSVWGAGLRPPAGAIGRMWDMRTSQRTAGHTMPAM